MMFVDKETLVLFVPFGKVSVEFVFGATAI
jgi:hypothetical protein